MVPLPNKTSHARRVAILGLMTVLAMILGYLDAQIPLPVPGVRLGLANVVIVYMLCKVGWAPAGVVNVLRITAVGLLFTGFSMIIQVP